MKEECDQGPAGSSVLLECWLEFKRRLACAVVSLNHQAGHRRQNPKLRVRLATEATAAALVALHAEGITAQRLSTAIEAQDTMVRALSREVSPPH